METLSGIPYQRFALDITVVDHSGRRARSLQSSSLEDYFAFGEPVLAPCNGRVVALTADLPDQPIGSADRENLAGNHVAIDCGGVTVLLAHLQAGSLSAELGADLVAGQFLGRIGNSGNTSEPHLHIHAVRGSTPASEQLLSIGEGVPIYFDGRFLVRGSESET